MDLIFLSLIFTALRVFTDGCVTRTRRGLIATDFFLSSAR